MIPQLQPIYSNETQLIKQARIIIDNATLIALPTASAYPVIAGPSGSNRIYHFLSGRVTTYTPVAYGAVDAGCYLAIARGDWETEVSTVMRMVGNLAGTAPYTTRCSQGLTIPSSGAFEGALLDSDERDVVDAINKTLTIVISNGQDFTLGGASNYALVSICYMIYDLDLGVFVI